MLSTSWQLQQNSAKALSQILFVIFMDRMQLQVQLMSRESLVGFIRPWPQARTGAACNIVWSSWNESPHLLKSELLCQKIVRKFLLWFGSELPPQVKEFSHLQVLFKSESDVECKITRRIGVTSAVIVCHGDGAALSLGSTLLCSNPSNMIMTQTIRLQLWTAKFIFFTRWTERSSDIWWDLGVELMLLLLRGFGHLIRIF